MPDSQSKKTRYRSVWISDTHLGTRGCKADFLLDFLKSMETEHLFLVGDIIDLWKAKRGWYWTDTQNKVLRRILKLSSKGSNVRFVPGNHDEYFREFVGMRFGDCEVVMEAEHTLADGRRLLILHGDKFDAIVLNHKWLAVLGSHLYDWILGLNTHLNRIRKRLGMRYWSLSQYLKMKAKRATKMIGDFEEICTEHARQRGFDGIVCGHIHKAAMRDIHGTLYLNDGDWVESCTALVEHYDGRLEIITWTDQHPELLTRPRIEEPEVAPDFGVPIPTPAVPEPVTTG